MADRYTDLVSEVLADLDDARREYDSAIKAGRATNITALQYFHRLAIAQDLAAQNVPYVDWRRAVN